MTRFKKNSSAIAGALFVALTCAPSVLADVQAVLVFANGSTQRATVSKAAYDKIEYKIPGVSSKQNASGDDIVDIQWADLSRARRAAGKGEFDDATSRFETAFGSADPITAMNARFEYARTLDMQSQFDPAKAADAEKAYESYLAEAGASKHFHVPQANLLAAKLAVRSGRAAGASKFVSKLADGSYGDRYKLEGQFLEGDVLLAQEKWGDARRSFSNLRSQPDVSSDAKLERRANLGYARGQFGEGQHKQAIETLKSRIFESKSGEPLDAAAADALILWGRAEEAQAGSDNEKLELAALRYLRAQSLALVGSEAQCEALYRASEVMGKIGRSGRQQQLRQLLLQINPSSPWAKK